MGGACIINRQISVCYSMLSVFVGVIMNVFWENLRKLTSFVFLAPKATLFCTSKRSKHRVGRKC